MRYDAAIGGVFKSTLLAVDFDIRYNIFPDFYLIIVIKQGQQLSYQGGDGGGLGQLDQGNEEGGGFTFGADLGFGDSILHTQNGCGACGKPVCFDCAAAAADRRGMHGQCVCPSCGAALD
jgi:hypothetical protein